MPRPKPLVLKSQLTVAFRHIKPSWRHYLDYVEASAREGDKQMARIVAAYYGLTRREQSTILPEQLCDLAGVKTADLVAEVCRKLWETNTAEANLITAIAYPKVVNRVMTSAASKTGVKDREYVLKHTGFLPSPAGPSININNLSPQTLIKDAKIAILPSMEDEMRGIDRAVSVKAILPVEPTDNAAVPGREEVIQLESPLSPP